MKRFAVLILIVISLVVSVFTPGIAADSAIQVEKNEALLNLPTGIIFLIDVQSSAEIDRITLLLGTSERTCQEKISKHDIPVEPARQQTQVWQLEFIKSGVLPQGVEIWWQWEITDSAGNTLRTEKKSLIVEDQRHSWHSRTNRNLTINWYQGDDSFGSQLLAIAANGMRRLESDMGIQFDESIRLTVYPTSNEMLEVLVYSQDWAGGAAFTNFNAIIMKISPSDLEWAREVIPHELAHMVVEARIFNCQGITIPTWLNEGLAVYAEGAMPISNKQAVMDALLSDRLPSLNSLSGNFSAYTEEAVISYHQSGMVVEYLIAEYGAEKMDELLTTIQKGNLIDEALREVYGFDTGELDNAWRESLGFSVPTSVNTTPTILITRTRIPTLALWTAPVQSIATLTKTPMAVSSTPSPFSSNTPAVTISPSPSAYFDNNRSFNKWVGYGSVIGISLIFLGSFFWLFRRRKA
ncbi:MAG: hypothetical protein JW908_12695 [Anaerolineales bacterium]|nr:hypothetical protein [Anaerolineales bacterium]